MEPWRPRLVLWRLAWGMWDIGLPIAYAVIAPIALSIVSPTRVVADDGPED